MKFRTKLALLVFFTSLIIVTILSVFVYFYTVNWLEQDVSLKVAFETSGAMSDIDRLFFETLADVRTFSVDPVISSRESSKQQITERLLLFRNLQKYFVSLSFFDVNHTRIADTSGLLIGKKSSSAVFWDKLKNSDSFVDFGFSESLGERVLRFGSVVRDKDGMPFGVIVARVGLSKIYEIVSIMNKLFGKEFIIELVNQNNELVYSTLRGFESKSVVNPSKGFDLELLSSTAQKGVARYVKVGEENIIFFVKESGYGDYAGEGWMLIVHVPTKVVFARAIELRNRLFLLLLACVLWSVFISLIAAQKYSSKIVELTKLIERISLGDLNVKLSNSLKSESDELGDLARAFDRVLITMKLAVKRKLLKNNKRDGND